jgi:hypothetical protein
MADQELSDHKRRVAGVYNLASSGYDRSALRFFRLVASRVVELADVQRDQRVLDVATGTEAAALAAARRVGPTGRVTGVDITAEMLAQARRNVTAADLSNVELHEAEPFGWQRLTDPEQCRMLLEGAGLRGIQVTTEQLGYHFATAGEWWEFAWGSGFRGPLAQLSPSDLERFKAEHLAEVAALATHRGIWFDVAVIFATGRAPAR